MWWNHDCIIIIIVYRSEREQLKQELEKISGQKEQIARENELDFERKFQTA